MGFEIVTFRQAFPILDRQDNGHPLIYFDNAATTQKPKVVIDAVANYYEQTNANIHRGVHTLAEDATAAFEDTRQRFAKFIAAKDHDCVIMTTGTTEAINLVAQSYCARFLEKGDEVLVSTMEHHSNIVPWQIECEKAGAVLKVIPVLDDGTLDMDAYESLLSTKTKIVSVVHASNALGTINDVEKIIARAHQFDIPVLVDGAQSGGHLEIEVDRWDVDFFVTSAHKMFGPTGVGFLYGKRRWLEEMPPYKSGGEMIKNVTFEKTTYNDLPYKFEAGTPNIASSVATREAINFIESVGKDTIRKYEHSLLQYATEQLGAIPKLKIIGQASDKVPVISFVVEGVHHFDIGQMLDAKGVAVRTGHHCTQPLMERFDIDGTTRASLSAYNTKKEIDNFVRYLDDVLKVLG